MSESLQNPDKFSPLKRARVEQGLTLEGLASLMKVTPAKLDALESGRYEELPDAAFARALAKSICRVLKIDPEPVMASLPAARPVSLAASEPREVPFEASRTRLRLHVNERTPLPWASLLAPRWLAPLGLLVAAAVVFFWPGDMRLPAWDAITRPGADSASGIAASPDSDTAPPPEVQTTEEVIPHSAMPAAAPASEVSTALPGASLPVGTDPSVPSLPIPAAPVVVPPVAPVPPMAASSGPAAAPAAAAPLVLAARENAWIEVRDARGARLLSRQVAAGETVSLEGAAPLSLKIGNAGSVQVRYLGQPIELAAFTRNNVARLELK